MLIDSYRSMIVRFASPATRGFLTPLLFLSCLVSSRRKKTSGTRVLWHELVGWNSLLYTRRRNKLYKVTMYCWVLTTPIVAMATIACQTSRPWKPAPRPRAAMKTASGTGTSTARQADTVTWKTLTVGPDWDWVRHGWWARHPRHPRGSAQPLHHKVGFYCHGNRRADCLRAVAGVEFEAL